MRTNLALLVILFFATLSSAGKGDQEETKPSQQPGVREGGALDAAPGDNQQRQDATAAKLQVKSVAPLPALVRSPAGLRQPIRLDVVNDGTEIAAKVFVQGVQVADTAIAHGEQTIEVLVTPVQAASATTIALNAGDQVLASVPLMLEPVRKWEFYIMHHTHLDIGYTHKQSEVEQLQMQFLDQAQQLAHQTDKYPPEARFKWLPEGLWAVESYLKSADDGKRKAFIEQVKAGRIGLDALYGNALTGLYSQEELFELVDYAVRLRQEYGVKIDSAMISDVPGYTWGIVPVLAQNGIRYLSIGPNPSHRIGTTYAWRDRPFYWVSPCGQHKVLCWVSGKGYYWFHGWIHPDNKLEVKLTEKRMFDYLQELREQDFPYDIVQIRYNIDGDNGPPDPHLSDVVRRWNEKYAFPRMVICTTSELFREFEKRYGSELPAVRGDYTPYWEDGAASTATDTAAERRAAERLVQAQALWAMLGPAPYPDDQFYAAWRNAILYDEHTWGAHNSITEPDNPFAVQQAEYKQQFALEAEGIADRLLDQATAGRRADKEQVRAIEVFNTNSWPRTDLVVLPADWELVGSRVRSADGAVVSTQRCSTGELAFLVRDVPPLGSARFTVEPGEAAATGKAAADGATVRNGVLTLALDPKNGAISELTCSGIQGNLVSGDQDLGLNDYVYVAGRDPKNQKHVDADSVKISVLDAGPLVATLRVESAAPGTRSLVRDIRLIDGLDRVEITNVIDKLPVREQEGVHFGFAFNVPDATVRLDMPWAVVRPEYDQIPGACKNFFAVGRWVDASNQDFGVTLATVDAPLVQMGAIRTDVSTPHNSPDWITHIAHSPTLFSYVMNNYWETNYKADQQGATTFRYSIQPHAGVYDQTRATQFGVERSQPLIAVPADNSGLPGLATILRLDTPGVQISSIKPSRDGNAQIVRLFAASGKPERTSLNFPDAARRTVYVSSQGEERGPLADGTIELPAYGIVTLRIER